MITMNSHHTENTERPAARLARRSFLKTTAAAALLPGGLEGILAAPRPPAFAPITSHWLAVPHSTIGNAVAYRKSWLKEAGATEYPKNWEEARKLFAVLKKKGKPYGQTLGHTFGDAPTFTYPMVWCYGAAETDKS